MNEPMIQTVSLGKKFGHLVALNGIDLTIDSGEVVGQYRIHIWRRSDVK